MVTGGTVPINHGSSQTNMEGVTSTSTTAPATANTDVSAGDETVPMDHIKMELTPPTMGVTGGVGLWRKGM